MDMLLLRAIIAELPEQTLRAILLHVALHIRCQDTMTWEDFTSLIDSGMAASR